MHHAHCLARTSHPRSAHRLAAALALACLGSLPGLADARASLVEIDDKLERVLTVLGPLGDNPNGTVVEQIELIREIVDPSIKRENPRHVWAAPFNNESLDIPGATQFPLRDTRVYLAAHNASTEPVKVRVQGVFGGTIVLEHDTMVPAGQTRKLIDDYDFLKDFDVEGTPFPDTYVVSSNVKVLPQMFVDRNNFILDSIQGEIFGASESSTVPVQLERMDCLDLDYVQTCTVPLQQSSWDLFVD